MTFELSERNKILLSVLLNEEKGSIDFFDHHTEAVSAFIASVTEKLAMEKIHLRRYDNYIDIHYFKFVLQTLSLKHLFQGTPLKSIRPDIQLHDLSTLYSSIRSLMELFLTINYLYYNHKSEDQATFRHLLYISSGLNHRQSYPVTMEESKKKQAREKKEIEITLAEIEANAYFKSLHPKRQSELLKNLPAFELGKKSMITESGLDNDTFYTMWRLCSNYSHSEYIEAIQLRDYIQDTTKFKGIIYNAYRICFMLNCYQTIKLTERFDLAKQIFNEQSLELRTIVTFHNQLILGVKLGTANL